MFKYVGVLLSLSPSPLILAFTLALPKSCLEARGGRSIAVRPRAPRRRHLVYFERPPSRPTEKARCHSMSNRIVAGRATPAGWPEFDLLSCRIVIIVAVANLNLSLACCKVAHLGDRAPSRPCLQYVCSLALHLLLPFLAVDVVVRPGGGDIDADDAPTYGRAQSGPCPTWGLRT